MVCSKIVEPQKCDFCIKDQSKQNEDSFKIQGSTDKDTYIYACDDVTYFIEPTLKFDQTSTIFNVHGDDGNCQRFLKDRNLTPGVTTDGSDSSETVPAPRNKCFDHISRTNNPEVRCKIQIQIWRA